MPVSALQLADSIREKTRLVKMVQGTERELEAALVAADCLVRELRQKCERNDLLEKPSIPDPPRKPAQDGTCCKERRK